MFSFQIVDRIRRQSLRILYTPPTRRVGVGGHYNSCYSSAINEFVSMRLNPRWTSRLYVYSRATVAVVLIEFELAVDEDGWRDFCFVAVLVNTWFSKTCEDAEFHFAFLG